MVRAIDGDALYQKFEAMDWYDNADRDLAEDLLLDIPALTPPNKWISVKEKLPEKKQDVLMLFKSGNMAVGWWYDADEHITFWCAYTDDNFYTDCDEMPTHWMPLPAQPAKEGAR